MSIRFAIAMLVFALHRAASAADVPKKSANEMLAENARTVLAPLVKAAADNQRLPQRGAVGARGLFRRTGDALTEYYVRAAATAARRLPEKEAIPAFLLALGIALDDSSLLRDNL